MQRAPQAPFPWLGGKSRVAPIPRRAFGHSVPNYVEPFAGSLPVLLGRPGGPGHYETAKDRDCYVSNFWRAVQAEPERVAVCADWLVNEADRRARHAWLAAQVEFRTRMLSDPDYFDARIAGWWVWGISQWIGAGWCSESGPGPGQHRMPAVAGAKGAHRTRLPSSGVRDLSKPSCWGWFVELAARLLLHGVDDLGISRAVREWCVEHGDDPRLRIALCGYEGEHTMPSSWRIHAWRAHGGYGVRNPKNQNKRRERIWLSPHCLPFEQQRELFGEWVQ